MSNISPVVQFMSLKMSLKCSSLMVIDHMSGRYICQGNTVEFLRKINDDEYIKTKLSVDANSYQCFTKIFPSVNSAYGTLNDIDQKMMDIAEIKTEVGIFGKIEKPEPDFWPNLLFLVITPLPLCILSFMAFLRRDINTG